MPVERVKEKDKDRDKDKEGMGVNIDDDDDAISLPHSIFGDRAGGQQRAPGARTPGIAPSASMAGATSKCMTASAGATGVGLGETGVAVEDRDREREREPVGKVPTRLTVKKASTRAQQEAKRASDLAVRSRR